MSITIQLSPSLEARLSADARQSGQQVEDLLRRIIEEHYLADRPESGAELVASLQRDGVIGAWRDRHDIKDSVAFARGIRLRNQRQIKL